MLRDEAGVDPERIRVIPHGPLDYLTRLADPAPLPPELAEVEGPVALFFGLIRPYKGVDLLLEAFAGIEDAELWVVGRPFGVELGDLAEARAALPVDGALRARGSSRTARSRRCSSAPTWSCSRTATPSSRGSCSPRSPSRKAILMSDVGGFPEVAALGAGQTFPAGDADALGSALGDCSPTRRARERLEAAAAQRRPARTRGASIAASTIALYEQLLGR